MAQRTTLLQRFVQEAQAAAQVRHTNTAQVLDFGEDPATGLLYLVQEFLSGYDLKAHLRARGVLPPSEAIGFLLPVMRALAYAHSKGVVHRDLKPDNIFLCATPDGLLPKLIDFGIAKVFGADGQSVQHTRTAQMMGTPLYMSPEQARGDTTVDHRTDIWSLGVVLYHLLTLRHPHEGATQNLIVGHLIFHEPTPIETYAPDLPPDVIALVHGALQRDPAHRFPTMDAFTQAARACSVLQGAPSLVATPHASVTPALPPPTAWSPQETRAPVITPPTPVPWEPPTVPTFAPPPLATPTGAPKVTTVPPAKRARRAGRWVFAALVLLGTMTAALVAGFSERASRTSADTTTHDAAGARHTAGAITPPPPSTTPVAPTPPPQPIAPTLTTTADAGSTPHEPPARTPPPRPGNERNSGRRTGSGSSRASTFAFPPAPPTATPPRVANPTTPRPPAPIEAY
jgi:serine/threonine-protein kinase